VDLVQQAGLCGENRLVTLMMMMIGPGGIWQSADRRITRGGVPQPDAAKQLLVLCPPAPGDGPRMLLTFTGIAEVPGGIPVLWWMRETIRGESRPVMPLLEHLRDRLTRDVGRTARGRHGLAVVGGILEADGRCGLVQIANVEPPWSRPRREFRLLLSEVTTPQFMAIGSGQPYISREDAKLAVAQAKKRPRRVEDHMGLLAEVNRRTAAHTMTVSPWCDVTYIGDRSEGSVGRLYRKPGEPPVPLEVSVMLDGIDLTETARLVSQGTWTKDQEEQATRRGVEGRP
jgi:hypothetical protein